MGGIVASDYAQRHADVVNGIVLLASYSTTSIGSDIRVCSVRGSNDGCLDIAQFEQHWHNLPENTADYVIKGGNHAQYGDYGVQKGDGSASVSDEEQQRSTVEAILECFGEDISAQNASPDCM